MIVLGGGQVEERVNRHSLDAGDGVGTFAREAHEYLFDKAGGAGIAVANRIAQQFAMAVKESEVNAPRVDGDAGDRVGVDRIGGFGKADFDFMEEAEDIPMEPLLAIGQRDG